MSYEYKSKLIGIISKELAEEWNQPELIGKPIYQFAKIHKHTEKHFQQFILGEKSKNYTMLHLKDVILNPDYVSYNIKDHGFIFYKKLLEYIAVTVKPTNDDSNIFCISTIYPTSKHKIDKKRLEEEKIKEKFC